MWRAKSLVMARRIGSWSYEELGTVPDDSSRRGLQAANKIGNAKESATQQCSL
jgi:hypothetical protein